MIQSIGDDFGNNTITDSRGCRPQQHIRRVQHSAIYEKKPLAAGAFRSFGTEVFDGAKSETDGGELVHIASFELHRRVNVSLQGNAGAGVS